MSFILNALRKSEQERKIRHPESLENRILEKQGDVQKKNSVWLIVLVIINAFFLIYLFWSSTKEDITKGIEKQTIVVEKSKIKDENKVNTPLPNPVKPSIKTQISIAELLKEKQTSKDKEKPEQLIENLAGNDIKEEPEQQNLQIVELEKKPVITTTLVEEPILETVTEKISREVQQENVPPFLSELDYDFRRIIPEVDINVFVYSEIKEDRFIMIDMKKYLPGQQLDSGMKLKEIRLNSIVVEYKNRVFQIQRN